ncbi:MAG: nuclear transport factor 2 family protein [Burkholderiales bacterium]|uniref:nuclear transport factor 2 family protein n=1 Tax=Roseateles sp. TaxID=1971397 RepID=UPI000F908EA7|nr:MAG: nuclear transport factor 2 family protein [Burkholderiales bacterium]
MSLADARLQALVTLYETLAPADLDRLVARYAEACRFKDPFNEVLGRAAVRLIFDHMFRSVRAPRFVVRTAFAAGDQAFLAWDFHAGDFVIRGASHLSFDAAGLVAEHRDYWDAAEELYEKLPVLGALMRLLKRRLRAQPA